MSGVRLEIQWVPGLPDKFITWGTEIYLYSTCLRKNMNPNSKSHFVDISDKSVAQHLATNSNHHYVKCVDIYPKPDPDVLMAIGQANGKVTLTSFGPSVYDTMGLTGSEIPSKHARQCNAISWNPVDTNLIAVGLDKYRMEHSVMVWDVVKGSSRAGHYSTNPAEYPRPCSELGLSDTAHSLAWLRTQPRSLVIGMNNKHLKLIDARDASKVVNSAPTKAVYGVVIAPFNDYQMASYFENQIVIWDMRSFDKPVLTLYQPKPVTKILWCPTRFNLLGSIQRDSAMINLHDVQQSVDDTEPSVLERMVQPGPEAQLTSFSWHPKDENRLLAITLNGAIVDYCVFERMTLNWATSSHLVWTFGRRTLKLLNEKHKVYEDLDDISVMMKRRAMKGYGLKGELWQNSELAENESLSHIWQWLHLSKSLVDDGTLEVTNTKHPGVRSVLGMDANNTVINKSELLTLPWADLQHNSSTIRVYRSEDRDKALLLCGWKLAVAAKGALDGGSSGSWGLERLGCDPEGGLKEHARAAAMAVFSLRLRKAIEILKQGARKAEEIGNSAHASHLNIVAMALSGYSDDKNSMWRELCINSRSLLSDPYLRAMFAFLTAESDTYDGVLNEHGMAVEDQVAFACTFLSNRRLADYLTELGSRLTAAADLCGLLLTGTGTTSDSVTVLQCYLDATGDVQSVSLLAARAYTADVIDNDVVQGWISSYRTLLDTWRMWTERAHLDALLCARQVVARPSQQVFVACNFCAKSIAANMQQGGGMGLGRVRGGGGQPGGYAARIGTTANRLKISSCPNCRKPQPRCAICLVNMGTPSLGGGGGGSAPFTPTTSMRGGGGVGSAPFTPTTSLRTTPTSPPATALATPTTPLKLSEFASWFTWCLNFV
ncbi:GATOR complex protein MIOS-B [Nilaparvata lugens]|uniref:GATOR complex protein MIOS-B n=1 Tax=Nilaparvata lugens TaxID=108931 RepID=UPI00193CE333|nr:GATOR complex protein MIOS-B [Nilaparvata lugens]